MLLGSFSVVEVQLNTNQTTRQIKEIGLCLELYLHANTKITKITEKVALVNFFKPVSC